MLTMHTLEPLCDLPRHFVPCEYRVKWAASDWEKDQAYRLRRAVFCAEQGIFVGDDLDVIDAKAQLIIALSCVGGMSDQVVGTVRIHQSSEDHDSEDHETDSNIWWGSRLAVHPAFRQQGRLGATLIRLAVTSAHARGCQLFLAHVQNQNESMFRRLHWKTLKEEVLHGRPHQLMEADLAHYPPCYDPHTGFVARSSSVNRTRP
jgi:putative N-acetyltransferase (TIGR04045 family)